MDKHRSSQCRAGLCGWRRRAYRLSHRPFQTQTAESWDLTNSTLQWVGDLFIVWCQPALEAVATALLLFRCCHLQILLRFGHFFVWKKCSQLKKELFLTAEGEKKKVPKPKRCQPKGSAFQGKKKDTLLNTIKETKPANASSVTCTALRLTSWIPSACGYHLALLYQLRLRVLSRVWALKPFPSWPASIKTETCRVGGLWLTSDHLLGHSN